MRHLFKNPLSVILLLVMAVYATRGGGFSNPLEWVVDLAMRIPGLVIGITIHEFAHAMASDKLGDPTPRRQGRVTLNPVRHFDLIGLISLILIGFGWGKPVEVSSYYYKHKRRDGFIVAVAGVAVNCMTAFLFTGLLIFMESRAPALLANEWVFYILQGVVVVNLALMVFNLLPIPPLDGFNMLTELLDLRRFSFWRTLYSYGFAILMVCIMLGVTGRIMTPALNFLLEGMIGVWAALFF